MDACSFSGVLLAVGFRGGRQGNRIHGKKMIDMERQGKPRKGIGIGLALGMAKQGKARKDMERKGKARKCKAWKIKERNINIRHGMESQGEEGKC
jgi:hypothetical protein